MSRAAYIKMCLYTILLFTIASCQGPVRNNAENSENKKAGQAAGINQKTGQNIPATNLQIVREYTNSTNSGRAELKIGTALFGDVSADPSLVKTQSSCYLVECEKVNETFLQNLKSKDIIIGYYIPENNIVIRTTLKEADLKNWRGVKKVNIYQPFLKLSRSDGSPDEIRKARVTLWTESDLNWAKEYCAKTGYKILSSSGKNLIVEGNGIRPFLMEDKVLRAEKYTDPALFSMDASAITKVLLPSDTLPFQVNSTSAKVAVLDMGVDLNHPDLKGAVKSVYDTAGDGDTGELTSHGTHIAGIIAGRGTVSAGKIAGVNPEASLMFFSMGDDLKGMMVPASVQPYLSKAADSQAYIVNMSWGTYGENSDGSYLSICRDIDEVVYNNSKLIVIAAAGNDGKSVASPATAKNVISVGALDGNTIATYSGRGGSLDGRVKPDVMVQGSGIESLELNGGYTAKSGTSQAAAVLSGLLTRIIPAIQRETGKNATFSVVKSFLLANTLETGTPTDLGYGRLSFKTPINTNHIMIKTSETGNITESKIQAKEGDELNFVLSWTDPASSENAFFQLINDYDLAVTGPDGTVYRLSDRKNNAEKIKIINAKKGIYTIHVEVISTPFATKDMALVIQSQLGFVTEETSTNSEQTAGVLNEGQNQTVVNPDVQNGTTFNGSQTGQNQGTASETTGGVTLSAQTANLPTGVQAASIPSTGSITSPVSTETAEAQLNSLGSSDNNNIVPELFFKPGQNQFRIRALGSDTDQTIGIAFNSGSWNTGEINLPVYGTPDGEYTVYRSEMPDFSKVMGSLLVRKPGSSETNSIPVQFIPDTNTPYITNLTPAEGKDLAETRASAHIVDEQSGVDTNFTISLNGRLLTNGEWEYNAGAGKISLLMDKIFQPGVKRPAAVKIAGLSDLVGNTMSDYTWNFYYTGTNDTEPPSEPVNLQAAISNKLLTADWNSNSEKDLLGYRVYNVSSDGLSREEIGGGILPTNNFSKTMKAIEQIGVTAVDAFSNESEMAVFSLRYYYPNYPPEVVFNSIPEITNSVFDLSFRIRDEGKIILTNIKMDGRTVLPVWSNKSAYLPADMDGKHTLSVVVMDDDSNTVTNTVSYQLDRNSPAEPSGIQVSISDTYAGLSWQKVMKNGADCMYLVESGNEISNFSGETNALLNFQDYGSHFVTLQAIDSLGNQSQKAYVLLQMDQGISLELESQDFSKNLTGIINASLSIGQYPVLALTLSNEQIEKKWNIPNGHKEFLNFDLQDLPEGSYQFTVQAVSNGIPLKSGKYFYQTNIYADRTSPAVNFQNSGKNFTGNYLVTSKSDLTITAIDKRFKKMTVIRDKFFTNSWYTNSGAIDLGNARKINVLAEDFAGNSIEKNITVELDTNLPSIEVRKAGTFIEGNVSDANLFYFEVLTNGKSYFKSDIPADGPICANPGGDLQILAEDLAGNVSVFTTNLDNTGDTRRFILGLLVNGNTNRYYSTHNLQAETVLSEDKPFLMDYNVIQSNQTILSSGWIGISNYRFSGVPDGDYTLTAEAFGKKLQLPVTVDTTSPVIAGYSNIYRNLKLREAVQISDANLKDSGFYLNGNLSSPDTVLSNGIYRLHITAFDMAGNSSSNDFTTRIYDAGTNYNAAVLSGITNGGYYNHPLTFSFEIPVINPSFRVFGQELKGINHEGDYTVEVFGESGGMPDILYTNSYAVHLDFNPPSVLIPFESGSFLSSIPEIKTEDLTHVEATVRLDGQIYTGQKAVDGPHSLSVDAVDMAGNTSYVSVPFYMDSKTPSVSISPAEGTYLSVTPAVSATDANLTNTILYLNGKAWDGKGSFTAEGKYEITVSASDRAGNITYKTARYIVDKTRPQIATGLSEGRCYYTNLIIEGKMIDENPDKLTVLLDGKEYSGNPITTEGSHKAVFTAKDTGGLTTVSNVNFSVRSDLPGLVWTGISGLPVVKGTVYSDTPFQIGVNLSTGSPEYVSFSAEGKDYGAAANLAEDGFYRLKAAAGVKLGGQVYEISAETNLVLDRKGPGMDFLNVIDNGYYTKPVNGAVLMTGSLIASNVLINNTPVSNSFSIDQDGQYTLAADCTDLFGRKARKEITFAFDSAGGKVLAEGIADGGMYPAPVRYKLVKLHPGIKSVQVFLNSAAVPEEGTAAQYGRNVLSCVTTDAEGNKFTRNWQFVIDTAKPVVKISGISDGEYVQNAVPVINIADDYMGSYRVTVSKSRDAGFIIDGNLNTNISLIGQTVEQVYTLTVHALDKAGNILDTNLSYTVDKTAPEISFGPLLQNGYYSNAVSVTVSDADVNRSSRSIFLNGEILNLDGTAASSEFLCTKEGVNQILVTARDKTGNTLTAEKTFTIDRIRPAIRISGINSGASNNQPFNLRVRVEDSNPAYMETIENLSENGQYNIPAYQTVSNTNRIWTAASDGRHDLKVTAYDLAGNSFSTNFWFVIDQTKPVLNVDGITNGGYYPEGKTISVHQTEMYPGTLSVYLDGNPQDNSGFTALEEGNHILIADAVDRIGNEKCITNYFTIDLTDPDLQVSGITSGGFYNQNLFPAITMHDINIDPNQSWIKNDSSNISFVEIGKNLYGSLTETNEKTFHQLLAHGADLAGRFSETNIFYSIDKVKPTVSVSNIFPGLTNYALPIAYASKLNNSSGLKSLALFTNGGLLTDTNSVISTNSFNFTASNRIQIDGTYTVTATAIDFAGNTSTFTHSSFILDATPPSITVLYSTNGLPFTAGMIVPDPTYVSNLSVRINVSDPNSISNIFVYDADENLIGSSLNMNLNNYSLNLTRSITASIMGTNILTVKTCDKAGNSTNYEVIYEFEDRTPPTVKLISFQNTNNIYFTNFGNNFYADGTNFSAVFEVYDAFGVNENSLIFPDYMEPLYTIGGNSNYITYKVKASMTNGMVVSNVLNLHPADVNNNTNHGSNQFIFMVDKKPPVVDCFVAWQVHNATIASFWSDNDQRRKYYMQDTLNTFTANLVVLDESGINFCSFSGVLINKIGSGWDGTTYDSPTYIWRNYYQGSGEIYTHFDTNFSKSFIFNSVQPAGHYCMAVSNLRINVWDNFGNECVYNRPESVVIP